MAEGPSATQTRHLRTLFALGAAGGLTDGQLLERFDRLGGDPAELAFAALVERHGPMVLRVARSALVDEASAHDAFQATFLILARKARSLWVRDSLGPWLHAVAYRVASQARSADARRRHIEKQAARPEAVQPDDPARDDLARAIHQEIDRLPLPYRLAVVTCHLEGLTQHEAAARLGWPVGTLQSRLARGRQKLRDRLQRRGLAPALGASLGKLATVPPAWIASTARLAATPKLGATAAGMIAPTVLAMIETTTKGMLMTKLKLGALALVMLGGVVGSGAGLGLGRSVRSTDEKHAVVISEDPAPIVPVDPTMLLQPVPSVVDELALLPLADPVPDIRPPDSPIILSFYADWAGPSLQMRPEVEKLVKKGYPIQQIDVDRSPELGQRYKVTSVPTFLFVDAQGKELARTQGVIPASRLAAFYNDNKQKYAAPAGENTSIEQEPPILERPGNPKPWETVVRIKMHLSDKEWGFGSGTVISSSAEESIILTCAHIFRVKGLQQPSPKDFRVPISVDLFGGQLARRQPAQLACTEKDLPGEAIDYDFTNDVGLIRIKPGRKLPSSRVVPTYWKPQKGMHMTTVGCSHGNDATAWSTTIIDPKVGMNNSATHEPFFLIKCVNQPKEGREGGGLFTPDGYVAGVCDFADPNEHVGLYAVPEAIHKLLDRNGLSRVFQDNEPGSIDPAADAPSLMGQVNAEGHLLAPVAEPAIARTASDQDRRLDDLEQKLDQVIKALEALKVQPPGILGDFPSRRGSNPKNR